MTSEEPELVEVKSPYNVQEQDTSPDGSSPSYVAARNELAWGETSQDVADMNRLGKKQEFKVVMSIRGSALRSIDRQVEKLQFSGDTRLRFNLHGDLGICVGVCYRPLSRRPRTHRSSCYLLTDP